MDEERPNAFPIEDFIPHRGRMKLVERLLEAETGRAVTEAVVGADWPLVTDGGLDPLLLIELVAQSAGCLTGWERRHDETQGGRGWLVGLRHTRLFDERIPVGTRLRIEVQRDIEVDFYAVFRGQVSSAGRALAEVEIQTYRPEEMRGGGGAPQGETK